MPNVCVIAAAGGSGRATPAKPTLTQHTSAGQFRITNYDANNTYSLSVSAGSISRATDIVTLGSATAVGTITATLPKSLSISDAGTCERKQYTCTPTDVFSSYIHAHPPHGVSNYGGNATPNSNWLYCTEGQPGEMQHQEGVNRKDSTPSGYTDSLGEWWKCA